MRKQDQRTWYARNLNPDRNTSEMVPLQKCPSNPKVASVTDPDNKNDEEINESAAPQDQPDSKSSPTEEAKADETDSSPASQDNAGDSEDDTSADSTATTSENDAADTAADTADDDELPEYEELTPEIVEEEAIRGDFMLRWAAIFLAVLFGFSQMADTRTLLHVRSGEQMRANGLLPSSQDSFSYALEGQSSSNVSWLFDHVSSAVYSLGGPSGLTVFKALVAGLIAYVLSYISLRNMPTWWNSICVVLAVAACSVDFDIVTDLVTLLGLSLTLLMLHRHSEGTASGLHWKLPVLIAIWANCDPRAYMGVLAVGLFAAGASLRKSFSEKTGDPPGNDAATLWKAAAFCLVALLVNPAPIASLLSVVTTYSVEYPTMAAMKTLTDPTALMDGRTEYYPIFSPQVLQGIEFAYVAGFSILAIAIIVLITARSSDDLPWAFLLLGFTVLALWKLHELPAAALVAAATAGTAAQRWYGRSFRQEYTVDTMEVLFSRGGRAVTVLAMALLGFFAVGDRLPTRTTIGLGFDPELSETIDSLGTQLAEFSDDVRILNTRVSQGDLLAWHGRQSFVDTRAALFGSMSDNGSVVSRFDTLRHSLLVADEQPAEPGVGGEIPQAKGTALGKEAMLAELKELQIDQVMLRLSPPGRPAYQMVRAFMQAPEWIPTSRGPSAAMFSYEEEPGTISPYDIGKIAFRVDPNQDEEDDEDAEVPLERFDFAREPGFYKKYLYNSRATASAALREAQHLLQLDMLPAQVVFQIAQATSGNPENTQLMELLGRALAGPTLAVRNANKALAEDPQNAVAYKTLGTAYASLRGCEQAIAGAMNGKDASRTRYFQAVMAFRQATTVDPDDSGSWRALTGLYAEERRIDLALECLNRFLELEEDALLEDPDAEAELTELYDRQAEWESQVEEVLAQVEELSSQPMPEDPQQQAMQKFGIAQGLAQNGHVRLALERMKADEAILRNPMADVLRGELLLEAGELDDGFLLLNQLAEAARDRHDTGEYAGVKWHTPVALSHLAKGAYSDAISAYQANLDIFERFETKSPDLMKSLVQMLPLVPAVDGLGTGGALPPWPITLLQSGQIPLVSIPDSRNEPNFMTGLAHLEDGNLRAATTALTTVVTDGGETPYRQLAAIYLLQLSDDAATTLADSFISSWEDFTFPGKEEAEESSDADEDESAARAAGDGADGKPTDSETKGNEKTESKDSEAETSADAKATE